MNIEMAPLLYEMALARLHAAKEEIEANPENGKEFWRHNMWVQKIMAKAELDALDKVLRNHGTTPAAEILIKEVGFFPKCIKRVTFDNGYAVCRNLSSSTCDGPCDPNCDHNVEE